MIHKVDVPKRTAPKAAPGIFDEVCALKIFAYIKSEIASGSVKGDWLFSEIEKTYEDEKVRPEFLNNMEFTLCEMFKRRYLDRRNQAPDRGMKSINIYGITKEGMDYFESLMPMSVAERFRKMSPADKMNFYSMIVNSVCTTIALILGG